MEYQTAVASGKSAALVDQHGGDVVRVALGRLPPGAHAVVTLDMALMCEEEEGGVLRVALPVATGHRYPLFHGDTAAEATAAHEEAEALADGARRRPHLAAA